MSGYSGTPLAKNRGIKKGHRLSPLDPPDGFVDILHTTLPAEVVLRVASIEEADVRRTDGPRRRRGPGRIGA